MSPGGPAVAVVGGGVIGCAVAWRLAGLGARVTLLERDRPVQRASAAAAGMLSPLKEAEEPGPFLDLGLRSLDRYPSFVEALESETATGLGYRRDGRLDVALDDAGADRLRRQHALQRSAGHESRLLDAAAVRRLEPAIAPDAVLGLFTPLDHQVDSARLGRALWRAAERRGVEVRTGATVAGVDAGARGRPVVRLEAGDALPSDAVVIAAGAWTGRLSLPRPLPVRPVRGQIVVLRMAPPPLGRVTWGAGCYLVPRSDGRLLVGATMEEAGFSEEVSEEATRRLTACAVRTAPALADAPVAGVQVGLRPATPDGLPILGADPELPALFYATGHFRNGILLAPETAELIGAAVMQGAAVHAAFSAGRFPLDRGSPQSRV